MNGMIRSRHARPSRGYLMTELVVAASLLITVMSLVASMTSRIGHVWQETAHQRAATTELSNQLERLTLLRAEQVSQELGNLLPSAHAAAALPEPELSGELVDDELGQRVVLRINWQRRHPAQPVEMVGWLAPASESLSQETARASEAGEATFEATPAEERS